jgi:ACS family hexuronate transporter-like MFS transporter
LITDPAWYFFQFWFPKYLHDVRGLNQAGVAIMGLVFAGATAGYLLGGFLSGRLVRHGVRPAAARLWVMLVSAGLAPGMALVPGAPTAMTAVIIATVIAYAATAWLSNLTALVVDLVPQRILGTAFGVIACGSALGALVMNRAVAWLVDHRSYNDCFFVMAAAYPLALGLIWHLRRRANVN